MVLWSHRLKVLAGAFALCSHWCVMAQYEVGLSGGFFLLNMYSNSSAYHPASFRSVPTVPIIASAWYREHGEKRCGLGLEVQWTRKAFRTEHRTGGKGSGTIYQSHVVADFIHINIGPGVRLDHSGRQFFRTGPQFGILIGGRANGTFHSWSMLSPSNSGSFSGRSGNYIGDFRWLFSIEHWSALSERTSLTFEPFLSLGITSIHKAEATPIKSVDLGLKVSMGLRIPHRTFWDSLRAGAPSRTTKP